MLRVAAIDIGSGKLKMVIGDVNPTSGEVLRIVYQVYRKNALARDVHSNEDQELSSETIDRTVDQFNDIKKEATKQGATRIAAVATEALRSASNVDDLLTALREKCGIQPRIVSQFEEAVLGFETACYHLPELTPSQLICWDCGSGSFQLTFLDPLAEVYNLVSYCGKLGKVPATKILIEEIQRATFKSNTSANPVSLHQMEAFLALVATRLAPPSEALVQKLASNGHVVVGIGADTSTFGLCATAVGSKTITESGLWSAVRALANKSDSQLKEAFQETSGKRILPPLLLIIALMRHLQIAELRYVHTMGSAAGVLSLPQYWRE